ncbi:MAG TPA: hypothetical protein VFJ58_00675 [Armatimonadota bacterium]|nr:hypothetical protein [Armatimonadota bacterium]
MTYPNAEVKEYIERFFIPVQYNVVEDPGAMDRFNSSWTPTLIVQDADGREHRRAQGYLDPKRFLGEMSLARLKEAIDRQNYNEAQARLDDAKSHTKGDPAREPEVEYWAAVVAYKTSHDGNGLLAGWNSLIDRFPESEWARRAEFIRQK